MRCGEGVKTIIVLFSTFSALWRGCKNSHRTFFNFFGGVEMFLEQVLTCFQPFTRCGDVFRTVSKFFQRLSSSDDSFHTCLKDFFRRSVKIKHRFKFQNCSMSWKHELKAWVESRSWKQELKAGVESRSWKQELNAGVERRSWKQELKAGVESGE